MSPIFSGIFPRFFQGNYLALFRYFYCTKNTQQDAIEYGRKLSIDSRSNLVIHRRDGTVQKKDTYSELAAESI